MNRIGLCFSKDFLGNQPLSHIGRKLPVYLHFLELCQKKGWEVYVLTRRTYKGQGVFSGAWRFGQDRFEIIPTDVKIDLVYDRSAGVHFPPENDEGLEVVNRRDFKILCWDKWLAYQEIGQFMPATFWVGKKEKIASVLPKIRTEMVVVKPFNGLKGLSIFIGPKKEVLNFSFDGKFKNYIAQEFIDTSDGIPSLAQGLHDLRVVIINGKPVWSHIRIPPKGSLKSNAAGGGVLKEIDYQKVPDSIKKIVQEVAQKFYQKFDNPIFSLDFGLGKDKKPYIFEINDQIGFPTWEMKKREFFLEELIINFEEKLKK